MVAEPLLPSVQSFAMFLFAYCGEGLVLDLLVRQSETALSLSSADKLFIRDAVALNCRALSLCCPLEAIIGG